MRTERSVLVVTGASGFCGAHIARSAARSGYTVIAVGRSPGPPGSIHLRWDASTDDAAGLSARLRNLGVQTAAAVVHCAATVGDTGPTNPFERVNVAGTAAVLAAAERLAAPVVAISSGSVYDHRSATGSIGEDHPLGGWANAYGRTKAVADRLALDAGARVLRPHAVYGPGDRYLLPRALAAVRGSRLLLPGPDVTLSITHVHTLTSAALSAPAWAPGAYNISDAEPVSRDQLLGQAVSSALGIDVLVHRAPAALLRTAAGTLERIAVLTVKSRGVV